MAYTVAMLKASRAWSFALAAVWATACAAGRATQEGTTSTGDPTFAVTTSGSGGLDGACAKGTFDAKNVPIDMIIMFDKSGSMSGPKWFNGTKALQTFFEDPKNAGVSVALRFFPDAGCDQSCNVAACAAPKVQLGKLTNLSAPTDTQEQKLLDAFVGVTPGGDTPLSAALDGAINWAGATLAQKPDEQAIVVLVTDGEPTDCHKDAAYFVNAAKTARAHGIVTFAVGLEGANVGLMDQIAIAGGSNKSIVISSANVAQDLQAALDAIRDKQSACAFAIPPSSTGEPVDTSRVNVVYHAGGGVSSMPIGEVPTAADCGDKAAWHYDNLKSPKKIELCPAACATIEADPKAKIEIVLGCGTIPG
jgi:hypothetical protein